MSNDIQFGIRLTADSKGLVGEVKLSRDELGKLVGETRNANEEAKKFEQSQKSLGGQMNDLATKIGIAGLAWKLYSEIQERAMSAARFETLGIVLTVVGRNAGYTSAEMQKVALGVQGMGITMLESRESVVKMAQAQIDLGAATKLARIAQDAAVIGNINSSEALKSLIYGIQSAQTDVLRTIGINVNFENSYKKLALQMHKSVESLTEHEKATARTNTVLEAGVMIAGTYDAAMGTAGKQITSLTRYTEDLKVMQGEIFNEVLLIAVGAYTEHLKDASKSAKALSDDQSFREWGRETVLIFARLADQVNNFVQAVKLGSITVASVVSRSAINTDYNKRITFAPPSEHARLSAEREAALRAQRDQYSTEVGDILDTEGRFEKSANNFFAKQDAARAAKRAVPEDAGAIKSAAAGRKSEEERQAASLEIDQVRKGLRTEVEKTNDEVQRIADLGARAGMGAAEIAALQAKARFKSGGKQSQELFQNTFSTLGGDKARLGAEIDALNKYENAASHAKEAEITFQLTFGRLKTLIGVDSPRGRALLEEARAIDELTVRKKLLDQSVANRTEGKTAQSQADAIREYGERAGSSYIEALRRQRDGELALLTVEEQRLYVLNALNRSVAEANRESETRALGLRRATGDLIADTAFVAGTGYTNRYGEEDKTKRALGNTFADEATRAREIEAARAKDAAARTRDVQLYATDLGRSAEQLQFETSLLGLSSLEQQKLTRFREMDLKVKELSAGATDEERARIAALAAVYQGDYAQAITERYNKERDMYFGLQDAARQYFESVTNDAANLRAAFKRTASTFEDMWVKGEFSAKKFFAVVGEEVRRLAFRQMVGGVLGWRTPASTPTTAGGGELDGAGGDAGGFIGTLLGLTSHTGSGPGDTVGTRSMPATTWDGAPRFHTGIGPNEVPAIITRDESVLTPGQMRQLAPAGAGAGTGSISVEIKNQGTPQQVVSAQPRFDGERMVLEIVLKDLAGNGSMSQAFQGRFGLKLAS